MTPATPVRNAAPAAAPSTLDPYADGGVVPQAADGLVAEFPNAALLAGFQLFNWDATQASPVALGRIQAQFVMTLPGGRQVVTELKTAKMPLSEIAEAGKALRIARPDLNSTMKLTDHPRGRKGAYHIRTFGVIDRNLTGLSDDDPYAAA